ncbi:Phosphatidylinositol-4-phosphate 5-kinase [Actinomortierella ambigua]|nr:Phosphatidylinositol-4-phosphate 5-kinase [Actinomortierella ambigua]
MHSSGMMDQGNAVYTTPHNSSIHAYPPGGLPKVTEVTHNNNSTNSKILSRPHTPPRISSLPSRNNNTQQVHPESPIPPRLSSLQQQHHSQQQQQQKTSSSPPHSPVHDHSNATSMTVNHTLEPSPTLSSTDTSTSTLQSVSSPGKKSTTTATTTQSATAQQSHEKVPANGTSSSMANGSGGSFGAGSGAYFSTPTSSPSSSPSSRPTARVRPVSYSPTKVTDPSSTAARLTSLATTPIPPASSAPSIHVMASTPPILTGEALAAAVSTQFASRQQPGYSPTSISSEHHQQQYSPMATTPSSTTTTTAVTSVLAADLQQRQQQQQGASNALLSQQLSLQQQQPQPSQQQQQPRSQPLHLSNPAPSPTAGAGGGYQLAPLPATSAASPSRAHPFGPPSRATTMEYPPGNSIVGGAGAGAGAGTGAGAGEGSSAYTTARPRRRQIYRRNTYSADLGSASLRHHSDGELEMDELEEARRRMEALKKSSSRRMSKRKKDEDDDRVLIGTRIGEDHVNYVLMYNMLTGIRVSVSRCNAKPQRALVDEDFTSAHKLAFDITGNELTPSSKYDFKFKDYAPWVFRHLREDFHIDASDYLVSLTSKYILSELGSPGKSGSFFYFSQDYRFIIKTIRHSEHKFMRKILKDYFNHVKQNPHTLLCRFFGLHRVKLPHGRKIHFVVMGNVFPPNRDIHETFDLKGSTLGRAISDEELSNNPRATQKDLNWVNKNRKLELGPERRHLFVEQIKRDVQLLARLNIMDYSLLIGIHDLERGNKDNIRDNTLRVFHPDTSKSLAREPSRRDKRESKVNALRKAVKVSDPVALGPTTLPSDSFSERRHCIFYADDGGLLSTNEQNERGRDLYYLGIIDILTPYNYVKKMEHFWKSLSQDKHEISAVNPVEYASRFLSFMIHALKVNNDVLPALEAKAHPHSE